MKIQKILALFASAAVAASMAAVPVSAAEITGATATATASSAAQVRAKDSTFTTKNTVFTKTAEQSIEMTQKEGTYFGAFYYFDDLNLPAGATVTSADLTVYKYTSDSRGIFKGLTFNVVPVTVSGNATNTDDIWTMVSNANVTEAETKAEITDKVSTDGTSPLVGNITSVFDGTKANAFFIYNNKAENAPRYLTGKAEISVVYSYTEPDNPVAQVGSTKYETFEAAYEAVEANGTITLLDDVTLAARFEPTKNITITASDKKTITGYASANTSAIISKAKVTFENVDIINGKNGNNAVSVEGSEKSLTFIDSTVTGNVIHGSGNNVSITLDNTQISGDISTRRGRDEKETSNSYCTVTLKNNSSANSVTYYYDAESSNSQDDVSIDETSNGGTITNTYEVITMTPDIIGSYTGEDGSVASAYKAAFTSTTGATASFNVADITWTLNGTPLSVAGDNTTSSVTVTVSGATEIVYGIIVEGAAGGTLAASFN